MKNKILSIALGFTMVASAAAADEQAAKPSNFKTMVKSLSNMLSSTNPKQTGVQQLEPSSGETVVTKTTTTTTTINNLPPLQAAQQPIITPQPVITPQAALDPEQEIYTEKLSPDTKRILRQSPSGIGSAPKGKPGKVSISRGDFDPEFGVEPAGTPEAVAPEETKTNIDVKVTKSKTGQSTATILDKAYRALNAGQYEGAIVLYKQVLAREPKSRDALFGLATAYHKAGQKQQAKAAYARLLAVYPKAEEGLTNMIILAGEEAPVDSLNELNILASRNPNFAPIYAQRAKIYEQMGDVENAKKNYMQAFALDKSNINYKYNLAVFLDSNTEYQSAAALYNELINDMGEGAKLPVTINELIDRRNYIMNRHDSTTL